ncbi:MAG: polysaccharide biosynthesis protein [Angelakisella sp.]
MTQRPKGQTFLEGAAILTAATLLVKVIGALFKIPLANILGGVGMSYFVTAYDLFTPIYSLAVTGLSVAVSRMVAEHTARGSDAGVQAVMRASRRIFLCAGVVGFGLMLAAAPQFVKLVNNPASLFSVAAIAPAVLFSCISAIYRGYYQGLSDMVPTAISQVIEAVARLVFGILFAYGVTALLLARYAQTGQLLGISFQNAEYAKLFILRFSAAGAIFGVTLSTAAGALYIRLRFVHTRQLPVVQSDYRLNRETGRRLVKIAVPIALSTLVVNLSSLIDLASVMNCLHSAIEQDGQTILQMYQGSIPPELNLNLLPEYLYGSYSGLAHSIFNLIPAITAGLGISAIPAVSRAWAHDNKQNLEQTISSILRLTMLVALPAGLGLAVLAKPILLFLYPARVMEVTIVAPILRVMGVCAVLVAAASPMNSILQSIGKERLPLIILLMGAAVKLITNLTLVPRPEINIQGVPYGTLLCYGVIVLLSGAALRICSGVNPGFWRTFFKPFLCAAGSSIAAGGCYQLLTTGLPQAGNALPLLLSIACAVAVYVFLTLFTGTICKNDLKMLPLSEKVLKRLEKLGFIS